MRRERVKTPNKETLKAIDENDRGEGVESYESIEDMFRKLWIK